MDRRAEVLLDRFAAAADDIADEIAEASMREVPAFEAMDDARLREEIRALAAQHVRAFTLAARTGMPAPAEVLAAARERAVMRARQMVPLSAMLHSHLIAQRIISAALTNSADRDAASRGIALELIARTFDYNIAVTSATAEAYLDIVQGDMLDLNAARRAVIDAAVAGAAGLPELTRRAATLGFAPDRRCALAVIRLGDTADGIGDVARAIAHATGRAERTAFVIRHDEEILAVLDAHGSRRAAVVLDEAFRAVASRGLRPHAGIGRTFVGLAEMPASYRDARRALRHAKDDRPVVSPEDLRLFDELTLARDDASDLIPVAVRETLTQPDTRLSLDAYVDANLNIAEAAARLNLHPNSLRYRLRRIAELTGLDPTRMNDLLELLAASRLMHDEETRNLRAVSIPGQGNQPLSWRAHAWPLLPGPCRRRERDRRDPSSRIRQTALRGNFPTTHQSRAVSSVTPNRLTTAPIPRLPRLLACQAVCAELGEPAPPITHRMVLLDGRHGSMDPARGWNVVGDRRAL